MVRWRFAEGVRAAMPSKAVTLDEKLSVAINDADEAEVEALLAKGADPNYENPLGFTQLMVACENCDPSLIRVLLKAGGDLSKVSFYQRTPLSFAIVNNNVDVVKMLLEMDMNLEQRIMEVGDPPYPSLLCPAGRCCLKSCQNALTLHPRPLQENYTYLIYAAKWGFKEICERLVGKGLDVDLTDRDGLTAIDHARRGRYNITAAFLEEAARKKRNRSVSAA